jgi:hypothetical protein
MATYTPVTKIIGTTGASGQAALATLITAQNAAVVTGVTTALAVTGSTGITVSNAALSVDTDSHFLYMVQTIAYTVVS